MGVRAVCEGGVGVDAGEIVECVELVCGRVDVCEGVGVDAGDIVECVELVCGRVDVCEGV